MLTWWNTVNHFIVQLGFRWCRLLEGAAWEDPPFSVRFPHFCLSPASLGWMSNVQLHSGWRGPLVSDWERSAGEAVGVYPNTVPGLMTQCCVWTSTTKGAGRWAVSQTPLKKWDKISRELFYYWWGWRKHCFLGLAKPVWVTNPSKNKCFVQKYQITGNRIPAKSQLNIHLFFLMSTCRHCCCYFSNANYLLSDSDVCSSAQSVTLKASRECTEAWV